MVDMQARADVAAALRVYMAEDITAFELDDALSEACCKTKDKTVSGIVQALWFYYDDITDHKVIAHKDDWAYFNRILLLLESGGEVVYGERTWHWGRQGACALLCLAALACAFFYWGSEAYLAYAVPLGLASLLIGRWESKEQRHNEAVEAATVPFPSVTSILSARRRLPDFVRARFPKHVARRRIRQGILWRILEVTIPVYALFALSFPLRMAFLSFVLAYQSLPWFSRRGTVAFPS